MITAAHAALLLSAVALLAQTIRAVRAAHDDRKAGRW